MNSFSTSCSCNNYTYKPPISLASIVYRSVFHLEQLFQWCERLFLQSCMQAVSAVCRQVIRWNLCVTIFRSGVTEWVNDTCSTIFFENDLDWPRHSLESQQPFSVSAEAGIRILFYCIYLQTPSFSKSLNFGCIWCTWLDLEIYPFSLNYFLVETSVTWFLNLPANCISKKVNYFRFWAFFFQQFWATLVIKRGISWRIMLHWSKHLCDVEKTRFPNNVLFK